MSQIENTSIVSKKIRPEWGLTPYKKPGCASYRVADDVIHQKIIELMARGTVKLRETRFILKLKSTQCLNCLHLRDGTCPYSEDEIKSAAIKFKKTPILCRHCGAPFPNFHYFLLKGNEGISTYTCETCQLAEENGTLTQKLKTQKKQARSHKGEEITSVIFFILIVLFKISADFIEDYEDVKIIFVALAVVLFIDFFFFMWFTIRSWLWKRKEKRK